MCRFERGDAYGDLAYDVVNNTIIGDPDPWYEDCVPATISVAIRAVRNIGDLLNAKDITWGWFQGGFTPSSHPRMALGHPAQCNTTTNRLDGTAGNCLRRLSQSVPVLREHQQSSTTLRPPMSRRSETTVPRITFMT